MSLETRCAAIALCATLATAFAPAALAQNDDWTGTNGNWSTAGDWSDGLPGSSSAVFITVVGGYTVTYNTGTTTVGSLTISNSNDLDVSGGALTVSGAYTGTGATTTVSGGTLTLNGSSTFGTLDVTSGTLGGTGAATIDTALTVSEGTWSNTGTVTVASGASATLENSAQLTAGGTLDVSSGGTLTLGPGGVYLGYSGGGGYTVNNSGAVSWTSTSTDSSLIYVGGYNSSLEKYVGATINNSGTWTDANAYNNAIEDESDGNSVFNNTGVYDKTGAGTTAIYAQFNNTSSGSGSGVVKVEAGALALDGGGTANSGAQFTGSTGTTLQFDGSAGYTLAAGSSIDTAGTVEFSEGTNAINGGLTAATMDVTGGTAQYDGSSAAAIGALEVGSGGTLDGTGAVNVSGSLTVNGGTLGGSGTVTLASGASATLENSGSLTGGGTLDVSSGGTLALGPGETYIGYSGGGGYTVNNSGAVTWSSTSTDSSLIYVGGYNSSLEKYVGATINNSGTWTDANAYGNEIYDGSDGNSVFNNTGVYDKTGAGTTAVDTQFNNTSAGSGSGVVKVEAGALALDGGGTANSGAQFTGSTGTTLQFDGSAGYTLAAGSSIDTAGTVEFSEGTNAINGGLTAATMDVTGGTAQYDGSSAAAVGALEVGSGSTLDGAGAVNVSGSLTVNGGTLGGSGTVTLASGGSATLENSASFTGGGTLDVSSGGTLTLGPGETYIGYSGGGGYTLNNAGAVSWSSTSTDSSLIYVGGYNSSLEKYVGATIDNSGTWTDANAYNNEIYDGSDGNSVFNNTGVYDKTGAGTTAIYTQFNNTSSGSGSGVVKVEAGALALDGGGTANSGAQFTGSTGTTLQFDGSAGYTLAAGSSIDTAGTVEFSEGTNAINGGLTAATMDVTGGTAQYDGSSAAAIGALEVGSGGTLDGTGAVNVSGSLTVNDGTLGGTGTVTVASGASATLENSGSLTGGGTLDVSSGGTLALGPGGTDIGYSGGGGYTLNNAGAVSWSSTSTDSSIIYVGTYNSGLEKYVGATINNSGTWTDANAYNNEIYDGSDGNSVLNNTGLYDKTGAGTTTIYTQFNNSGTGLVQVGAGALVLDGGGTSSATGTNPITSSAAGFATAAGATTQFGSGTYTISGSGASVLAGAGTYLVSGTLTNDVTGSPVEVSNLTITGTLNGAGAVNVSGALDVSDGTVSDTGAVTVASGGSATLETSASLTGGGTLDVSSGGTLTFGPGGVYLGYSGGGGYTVNNSGTVSWTSTSADSSILYVGGYNSSLSKYVGATIDNSGAWTDANAYNNEIYDGSDDNSVFNNTGLYDKTGAGTTTIYTQFNNSGTGLVEVGAGTLVLNGGGTGSATGTNPITSSAAGFATAAGATTEFGTGTYTISGSGASVLAGAGTYQVTGTLSNDVTGSPVAVSNLTITGTLNGTGAMNVSGALDVSEGTISDTGAVTVTSGGSATLENDASLSGGGTLSVSSGGMLTIGPGGVYVGYEGGSGYTLENAGTATWSSTSADSSLIYVGGYNSSLEKYVGATIDNSGTWTDANPYSNEIYDGSDGNSVFDNSGTYDKTGAGTTTITTGYDNSGLTVVQTGTLSLQGSTTNGGTLEATNGGAIHVTSAITNFSGNTLTGGTYEVNGTAGSSAISLSLGSNSGGEIVNNAANIVLSGANSNVSFVDANGNSALSALAANTTSTSGLTLANGYSLTTAGGFSNAGTVTVGTAAADTSTFKIGSGGAGTYSQSAAGSLTQGTGTIEGNVNVSDGTIAPGSTLTVGTLTISGNYTQSGGTFTDVLGSLGNGLLDVTGKATLSSSAGLDIVLGSGFVATDGTKYTILTGLSGLSGAFDNGSSFEQDGYNWTLSYSGGDAILDLVSAVGSGPTDVTATWSSASGSWTTASEWACTPGPSTCAPDNTTSDVYETALNSAGHTLTIAGGNAITVNTLTLTAGTLDIASGASLDLANQADGVTDIAAGTGITVAGTFTVTGGASALGSLGSVEGSLILANGATTTVTPTSGTLSVSSSGSIGVQQGTDLAVVGNVTSSGAIDTGNGTADTGSNTLSISGGLDNSGTVALSAAHDSVDVGGALTNSGTVTLAGTDETLSTTGALTNGGTVTVDAGDTVKAASVTNNSGIEVAGNLQATGAIANNGGATLSLQGGTVSGSSYTNAGATSGNGTVSPQIANTGTVEAEGGTLTASNGIVGSTGTVKTDAGGTLAIAADSTAGTLANNGTLATGGHDVTVSSAYTNANFGSGNGFNADANVTGGGEVLAAGSSAGTAQTISVNGGAATSGNTSIDFGNVHVGTTSAQSYTISNANSGGPALQGAIQTSVNGGNITASGLSGSGATAGNWGPVAAGDSTSAYTVSYDPTSAGALSGQAVHVINNFGNTDQQTVSIAGAAYAYATPTVTSSLGGKNSALSFGVVQVGQSYTDQLTITNTLVASNATYQEGLNASFGSISNSQLSGSGSITNLAAGDSDSSSMSVTLKPTSAGTIGGNVALDFASNGATTSGLGITALASQTLGYTWSLTGTVVNQASPSVSPTTINFGNVRIGSSEAQALTVENVATEAPQASLDAQFGSPTGAATSNGGTISELAAGSSDDSSLVVGLSTSAAGAQSGTDTVTLQSDSTPNGCTSNCIVDLTPATVTVEGNVFRLATGSAQNVNLGAVRVGQGSLSGNIAVTNTAAADGYSENLDAAISGTTAQVTSAGGSVSGLAAGQTNSSGLTVALDSSTAGQISGTATVQFQSDGKGIDNGAPVDNGSQTVTVTGNVYTPAVAQVNTSGVDFGVVHVGAVVGAQSVSVTNGAQQTALNDVLQGSLAMGSGSASQLSASGNLGTGLGAQATNSTALTVALDTSKAGVYAGTADFNGVSHDSQLSNLQLATLGIGVSAQVNNYADAAFTATGAGSLVDEGGEGGTTDYVLNLGDVKQGSSVSSVLSLLNDVSAQDAAFTDELKGYFAAGTLTDLMLSGTNWSYDSPSNEVAGLAAGDSVGGLGISVNTTSAGSFDDTITFDGQGYYDGASYGPYADDLSLTVEGDVVSSTNVPEPGVLSLFAVGGLMALALRRRFRQNPARKRG